MMKTKQMVTAPVLQTVVDILMKKLPQALQRVERLMLILLKKPLQARQASLQAVREEEKRSHVHLAKPYRANAQYSLAGVMFCHTYYHSVNKYHSCLPLY